MAENVAWGASIVFLGCMAFIVVVAWIYRMWAVKTPVFQAGDETARRTMRPRSGT